MKSNQEILLCCLCIFLAAAGLCRGDDPVPGGTFTVSGKTVSIPISNADKIRGVGAHLPLLQENKDFYIALLPDELDGDSICAFKKFNRKGLPIAWVTEQKELIFGERARSSKGTLYLITGTALPITGKSDKHYTVEYISSRHKTPLLIPKKLSSSFRYTPPVEKIEIPEGPTPEEIEAARLEEEKIQMAVQRKALVRAIRKARAEKARQKELAQKEAAAIANRAPEQKVNFNLIEAEEIPPEEMTIQVVPAVEVPAPAPATTDIQPAASIAEAVPEISGKPDQPADETTASTPDQTTAPIKEAVQPETTTPAEEKATEEPKADVDEETLATAEIHAPAPTEDTNIVAGVTVPDTNSIPAEGSVISADIPPAPAAAQSPKPVVGFLEKHMLTLYMLLLVVVIEGALIVRLQKKTVDIRKLVAEATNHNRVYAALDISPFQKHFQSLRTPMGKINGPLNDFTTYELIYYLHSVGETGGLELYDDSEQVAGELFFSKGEVVHAFVGNTVDDAAVLEILGKHYESFCFTHLSVIIEQHTIRHPIMNILTTAGAQLDLDSLPQSRSEEDSTPPPEPEEEPGTEEEKPEAQIETEQETAVEEEPHTIEVTQTDEPEEEVPVPEEPAATEDKTSAKSDAEKTPSTEPKQTTSTGILESLDLEEMEELDAEYGDILGTLKILEEMDSDTK